MRQKACEKQVALVTGGANGIGFAIAKALLQKGYAVAVVDKDAEREAAVMRELAPLGALMFLVHDLLDLDGYGALLAKVEREWGRLDVLVNNAASGAHERIADITPACWETFMKLSLEAVVFMSKAALPLMIRSGGGSIINMGSVRSQIADGRHFLYGAAKSAIASVTRELAVAGWMHNIRVNTVSPGFVVTPMTRHYLENEGWKNALLSQMLIPTMIECDDIASVVAFLISREARAINGQEIVVDGGLSIHRGKPGDW